MKLPALKGVIRRRILVNYRVDPTELGKKLPDRFRPKLHNGFAIGGICLIRLEHLRPRGLPAGMGVSSENAAHRIAVLWDDENGVEREGVFIPRRNSDSSFNVLLGGRLFPGEQHRADFEIMEEGRRFGMRMCSVDGETEVRIKGTWGGAFPTDSCFEDLETASAFFEDGGLGYSATRHKIRLDGISLHTERWEVEPLQVEEVFSSYFADYKIESATFDCALAMRNLEHEWRAADSLRL